MKSVLISAGDYSADLHGESLVRELRALVPDLRVTALGGVKLKGVADRFLHDMVELDVSGFTQPIKQFFRLMGILKKSVFPLIDKKEIGAVILIDYYGFNIHIAEHAKAAGVPVFYFVSPQVWASRRWRIQKLKETVTKMLVIFPFEEELYRSHGVPVEFVGNPLIDGAPEPAAARPVGPEIRLGLLPGSRQRELVPHIPLLLGALEDLRKKFPKIKATLFAVDAIPDPVYREIIRSALGRDPEPGMLGIVRDSGHRIRLEQDLCITASGTATLENALLGLPMVVIYKTSWLTYLVARWIIQVKHISMPNILAGREIVPELIQHRASPGKIAETAAAILSDPALLASQRSELIQLRKRLGPPGAYRRAAQAIAPSL